MTVLESPLSACLTLLALWLAIGFCGVLRPNSFRLIARVLFPLGASCGALLAAVAAIGIVSPAETVTLLVGLPDLPFHARLDALSGVFLFLLGAASTGISVFAAGYFRKGQGTAPGLLCLQYHLFLAAMGFVLLADDAYGFMVAWETMALSSYFLVTAQHGLPEIRRAGFLYLLIAHLGAISILLSFGVMQGGSWQFTFDAMRAAHLAPGWAAAAFGLALVGFGAKAGLVPLHVWLPEAHPAAPSPVSALMSGIMLKTAVYGVLRVTFDLLGDPLWWWGLIPVAVGLGTALFGVVFAAAQTDMKRLLAYSSVENIGILFTGIGLAIVFQGVGMRPLAALALTAVLYHALNHAFMKSLLFLGTGAVLHATGERNLGRLGGLIHRMPWVAWLTLVGALAIAGLPPLNGFVSEWLLLQSFLFAQEVPHPFVNMLLPLGASVVALAAALAGYVMVKFYGVIFLGQPREPSLANAHDAGQLEKLGLSWLAAGCVLLGLLPVQVVRGLGHVTGQLTGHAVPAVRGWSWLLAPLPDREVSYAPLVLLLVIIGVVAITYFAVRGTYRRAVRRAPAWDCGFVRLDARMQDTAEGFGQPIRHIFQSFFHMDRELPSPFDSAPQYRVTIGDRIWIALYEPLGAVVQRVADAVAWLQQGRISTYLLYSFITLVLLLAVVL
ncbi:MAG: hydrogenase 4 subunit B [Gammaproteobacteria bacterium]|nr:hydrogenase 4 subunit B [Gammaproteobacteria bacterium]